jgi:hypothetical protein
MGREFAVLTTCNKSERQISLLGSGSRSGEYGWTWGCRGVDVGSGAGRTAFFHLLMSWLVYSLFGPLTARRGMLENRATWGLLIHVWGMGMTYLF